MIASEVSDRVLLKYGAAAQGALVTLITEMGVGAGAVNSTEAFIVKLMEMVTAAEANLPDALKQNNFSYSIGEGGLYRGTIKAVVQANYDVIG